MLSQLIERFIKRLCGRWLRGFDGSQVNVSLGGTVTLEDLDLKTEELRALLLPYEPVSASVRRLRLEIDPLSSSLRVDVENVDVALTARSAFDAADARDAVERAVHLYFTTYLRPPKQSNTNDAGAAALRDLLKSSELTLRRLHVRVTQSLALRALGDGRGQPVRAGFFLETLDVRSAPGDLHKRITIVGLAAYCAAGPPKAVFARGLTVEAGGAADAAARAREAARRQGDVVLAADLVEAELDVNVDIDALLNNAGGPWLTKVDAAVSMARVRVTMSDVARRFLLDAAARFRHSHRRRQDVARRPLARWARALAAVRADLGRRPRPDHNDDATRWRRYFDEWRACAKYVARRKLLVDRVKCGVFADAATGEAYYELGERFGGPAGDVTPEDRARAARAVRRLTRPRRYAYPDDYVPTTPTAVVDLEDEDLELDGWDRDESNVAVTRAEDLDDAVARALDAEQRRCDRTWPVERAAACRAVAARHMREAVVVGEEVLVIAVVGCANVPAATVNLASDRRARVDVRVGAAPESYFGGDDDVIKSKPAVVEDDACAFHEVLEVPVARGAERTLRVSLVEVGATYDSVLAAAAIPLEDLEPAPSRKGTRTVAATLDLAPKSLTDGFFSRILTASCSLEIVAGRVAVDGRVARKAVAGHLDRLRDEPSTPPAETLLSVSLAVEDLDARCDDYRVTAARLAGASDPVRVPRAAAHRPGGSGEGSVAYACSRALRALLARDAPAEVCALADAVFEAPGRAARAPRDLSFRRVGRVEAGWFDATRAADVRVVLDDGAVVNASAAEVRVKRPPLDGLAALLSRASEGDAWGGAWDCDGYRVAVRAPVAGARFCVVGAPASLLSVAGAPPRVVVADDDAVVAPVAPREEVVAPTRVALPSSPAAPTTKRPSCCVVS